MPDWLRTARARRIGLAAVLVALLALLGVAVARSLPTPSPRAVATATRRVTPTVQTYRRHHLLSPQWPPVCTRRTQGTAFLVHVATDSPSTPIGSPGTRQSPACWTSTAPTRRAPKPRRPRRTSWPAPGRWVSPSVAAPRPLLRRRSALDALSGTPQPASVHAARRPGQAATTWSSPTQARACTWPSGWRREIVPRAHIRSARLARLWCSGRAAARRLVQPADRQRQGPQVARHLLVVARPPAARLPVGEVALVALDAADELRDHLLARHARQHRLARQVEVGRCRFRVRRSVMRPLRRLYRLCSSLVSSPFHHAEADGRIPASLGTALRAPSCVLPWLLPHRLFVTLAPGASPSRRPLRCAAGCRSLVALRSRQPGRGPCRPMLVGSRAGWGWPHHTGGLDSAPASVQAASLCTSRDRDGAILHRSIASPLAWRAYVALDRLTFRCSPVRSGASLSLGMMARGLGAQQVRQAIARWLGLPVALLLLAARSRAASPNKRLSILPIVLAALFFAGGVVLVVVDRWKATRPAALARRRSTAVASPDAAISRGHDELFPLRRQSERRPLRRPAGHSPPPVQVRPRATGGTGRGRHL